MKIKLLIAAAFTLAGCASMDAQGPMFEKVMLSSPEKSYVYLFKPDSAAKDSVTTCLTLTLNNVEYGCVKGKGYIVAEVAPGSYQAALVNKASFGLKLLEFNLEVKPAETTYLEYAFGRSLTGEALDTRFAAFGFVFSGNHVVAKIQEESALAKLSQLALSQ